MTERWRCFVAVELGDALRGALAQAMAGWRAHQDTDGLRWVEPENLHLTLAFLGDVDPATVPAIEESLRAIAARHPAYSVPTGRLGAFPRSGSARVLWYAVGDPEGALGALAAALTEQLGLAATEPFRPHITVARARRRSVDLRGWIDEASAASPHGRLGAGAVHLKRSHLGGGPARYETLATAELGMAAHV